MIVVLVLFLADTWRSILEDARRKSSIYDVKRWVGGLEACLTFMWELHAAGRGPMHMLQSDFDDSNDS